MESEVFQLLPARGIDRSLLLAVLAGLWILFFFAEVYGWVFTGLVVPGYLAAVFVVQPVSGAAIVTEGLLTFLLARGISDLLARTGAWSRFFGRERFFLILLISVLVRQHCELWLFPLGIEVLGERFGVELTFQHEFFGVGLVLVPLLSNMFWKLSTWRGLVQIGVPTALTYALLALVILPLTNYGLTSLELTYEDVAVNFLGTAKIYIILLVTAFLAAQMNLYAGWDYGGILVPALLAVAWFTPLKVLTTVAEALVLAAVVSQAMRVWPLRKLNLESGRKMVVVFTIGFELKVAIAWGIGDAWPGLDVTDLFGFGYLMPSLLAVKMLNRRAIGRVLGPTLAVSAAGLVFGSVLGLALERVVVAAGWSEPVASAPAHPTQPAAVADAVADPLALALMAHLRAVPQTGPAPARRPEQQERVGTLWRQIDRWLAAGQIEPPAAVETRRRALGFALARLGAGHETYGLFEESVAPDGRATAPSAVLHPGRPGPFLWVPRPATDAPVAAAALVICERLGCRGVVYAGIEPRTAAARRHRAIVDALSRSGVIELHADATVSGNPVMHLFGAAPPGVALGALDSLPDWNPPPAELLTHGPEVGRAVLRMNPTDLWEAALELAPSQAPMASMSLDAFLAARLDSHTLRPAPASAPTPLQAALMERLLARALVEGPPKTFPTREGEAGDRLRRFGAWLDLLAEMVGHQVVTFDDALTGRRLLALVGPSAEQPGWMVLVASPEGAPLAFEVPRPLRQGGTWRFALDVWREERARALLIAVPRLAPNQTVAAAPTGAGSAFHAAHTAMHAALANPTPGLIVQVRGHGGWRALQDHGILALETPIFDIAQVPEMVSGLAARVEARIGPPVRMYRSPSFKPGRDAPLAMAPISRQDADLVGLVSQPNVQRDLARRYGGTRFLRLWLSERVRADYLLERPPALPGSLSDALGDPLTEPGLAALLREPLAEPPPEPDAALAARFEAAFDLARRYAITDNPHLLRLLLDRAAGDAGLRVWRGFAPGEGRPYLLVEQSSADEVHRGLVYEHAEGDIWQSPAPEAPPISLRGHGGARVHGQRVAEGAP